MGKKKKKKAKKVKYVGGKRKKGQWKSKAKQKAAAAKAKVHKAKGIGLFKPRTLSASLAAITGKNKMTAGQMVKSVWAHIKAKKLNKGRTITPDAKLKAVLPVSSISMFKMHTKLWKHVK